MTNAINLDARKLPAIIGRMLAEDAKDFSDSEIDRTLSPCVCGNKLVIAAKRLRDTGAIREYLAEVFPSRTVPTDRNAQEYEAMVRIVRLVNAA
jgi:hypothetical protein